MTAFDKGRRRLAESGLTLACSEMARDERPWVVETLCMQRHRAGEMPVSEWLEYYRPVAMRIIDAGKVTVASSDVEGHRIALGFLVVSPIGSIEHIYVKREGGFRGNGIGLTMVESSGLKEPVKVARHNECWRRWTEKNGLTWRNG